MLILKIWSLFPFTIDLNIQINYSLLKLYEIGCVWNRYIGLSQNHFLSLWKTFVKRNRKLFSAVAMKSMIKTLTSKHFKTRFHRLTKQDLLFEEFLEIFQLTIETFFHCSLKKVRYYNNPFMTKNLRKEIMIKSKSRNKFNKCPTSVN